MTDEGGRKREESLRVFNQAAATYDRVGPGSFSYFGQRLVEIAKIPSGANVLDVVAGRGALLFPAAARVGPTGHVTVKIAARFDTPLQIESALHQAGFESIRITVEEKEFVYADEEQYWSSLWSAGYRRQLEKLTPALLEQAKCEVFQKLQTAKKPDGFHKISRALFAFGTKPVS